MKPAPFEYVRPRTLPEALRLLAGSDARPIAGGQSLGPMLNLRVATPRLLVDISRLAELTRTELDRLHLVVGAGLCHAGFEDGVVADVANGLLARVASGIAYRAVRNRGTIGGSLAHADPAADWPPVLLALDAIVKIAGPHGARECDVAGLITGVLETSLADGELIETIRIARAADGMRFGHHKACCKPGDFAESIAVVVRHGAGGRTRAVLSGRGLVPVLLPGAAAVIESARGWSGECEQALRQAVLADLDACGAAASLTPYERVVHQAGMVRAAREACSA
jgi:aerobic carbon-monoxide dehydrogenase medium subunit